MRVQARQHGRNFTPGEAMIYSNGGYHVVSHALARAAGQPFERLLEQRLFKPLGMEATSSVPSDHVIVPGMATLHVPDGNGGWRRGLFPGEDIRGEGGIVSTLDDMMRWAEHLYQQDRFGRLESWRALFDRPVCADGTHGSYALGMTLGTYRGTQTEHHAGGVIGGSCQLLRIPEHCISIVIIANGALAADPTALAERCVDVLLCERLDDRPASIDASPYAAMIGDYVSTDTGMLYGLVERDGALMGTFNGSPHPLPLFDLGKGRVAMRMAGLSDIEFDLANATTNEMPITFGLRTDRYRRCTGQPPLLSPAICGRYWSADGACDLSIDRVGEDVCAQFSDAHGRSTLFLHPCASDFAIAARSRDGAGPIATFTFDFHEDKAAGLCVATMRTRHLKFERRDGVAHIT
jgi:D-aminopeptidase